MQLDAPLAGRLAPFVLAAGAAAVAATLVSFHWIAFVLAALLVVVFSAFESEPFLLFMIFLLPLHSVPDDNLPELIGPLRSLLVAGYFLGRLWRGEVNLKRLMQPSLSRAALLFAAAAFLSVLFGTEGWTHDSALALARVGSYLGFYFFIVSWVDSRQRMRKVGLTLLAATILVALFAICQEIAGGYTSLWLYLKPAGQLYGDSWDNRATSFFGFPNSLANYMNFMIPFALACHLLAETARWKKLSAWSLGLGTVALACSQSRGGLVALGFVLMLAIFYFGNNWRIRFPLLFGLGLLGLLSYFVGTILNLEHLGEIEKTGAGRLLLWDTAWKLFTQSPIFGVGWGNFEQIYGYYIHVSWIPPGVLWVHNLYLQLLSETGLVGFGAFFFVVFIALREARRQMRLPSHFHRALSFGVFGAILTMLVHGFVDTIIGAQIAAIYWMWLALLAASGRLCSTKIADAQYVGIASLKIQTVVDRRKSPGGCADLCDFV